MLNSKKIIIVTGGAGFVGSNLIKLLLTKTKLKILSIDNYSSGTKVNHIKNNKVKYVRGDTNEIFSLISFNLFQILPIIYFRIIIIKIDADIIGIRLLICQIQGRLFLY